jgi:T5SS/PEP-CTERM-associated repeat protein
VNGGTLNTCNELHVGYSGNGTLKITNGGVVNTTFGADIGAATATANGAVSVDGTNSTWTIGVNGTGNIYVGGVGSNAGGTGLLQITNGATVNAASAHVYKSGTVSGNS